MYSNLKRFLKKDMNPPVTELLQNCELFDSILNILTLAVKCESKNKSYPISLYLPIIQLVDHVFSTFSLQVNEKIVIFGVI